MNILKKFFGSSRPHPMERKQLLDLAETKMDKEELDQYLTKISNFIATAPQEGWLYYCRASAKLNAERIDDQFFEDCEKTLRLDETIERWKVNQMRGRANAFLGNIEQAIKDFSNALDQTEDAHLVIYIERVILYEKIKRHADVIHDCDAALEHLKGMLTDKLHRFLYMTRAHAYYSLRDFNQALADYNQAISSAEGVEKQLEGRARLRRSYVYAEMKQFDAALEDCMWVIQFSTFPNERAKAHLQRSSIHSYRRDYEQALVEATDALDLFPNSSKEDRVKALLQIAYTCINLNKLDTVIDSCIQILELIPDHLIALVYRCIAYYALKDYDSALADYAVIQHLEPKTHLAYINRSAAHLVMGKATKALEDTETAIQFDPDEDSAYLNRAHALFGLQRYSQALSDFEKVAEMKEGLLSEQSAIVGQSLCHYALGNREKSLQLWRQAAEKNEKLKRIETFQEEYIWHEDTLSVVRQIVGELYDHS